MPSHQKRIVRCFCIALFAAVTTAPAEIDFNRDIRPILSGKCFACHGPDEDERGGDLRLDTEHGSRDDLGGYAAVVPGDTSKSELIYRVTTDDEDDLMPPEDKGDPLGKEEVALLEQWIKEGGDYAAHWSYVKPIRPQPPATTPQEWPTHNAIDRFIHRRLESEGLVPSPEADRRVLARRVALDLTGLPPTWEEANAFANDPRPDAYEHFVESQLAKPAFGERWAAFWLDLARYADSAGYADDPARTIWAYRDWVIRAFNQNQPFNQFTIDQIAGDLLQNPSSPQLIATAFNRNTLTNSEGGTNDEEFRNAAIVDRVNTTMEVWMGTTIACAQCHTHKYDPLTQTEYFQLFDFYNQSADTDKKNEQPLHEIWSDEQLAEKESLDRRIMPLNKALNTGSPKLTAARNQWLGSLHKEPRWETLSLQDSTAPNTKLVSTKDGGDWISQEGTRPDNSTYTLRFPTTKGKIAGLRLEVGKDQATSFVLSQVTADWSPENAIPVDGRFVRVELPGKNKMIHLAEVEVFSNGKNIASTGSARQSSTAFQGPARLGIDGDTNGFYQNGSVTHTTTENNPWFEIDLKSTRPLDRIVLWNRSDDGLESRLAGYRIVVLDESRHPVWEQSPDDVPQPSTAFPLSGSRSLNFQAAFADYEENGFPASSVIAKSIDKKKGWSVGKKTSQPHELALVLTAPVVTEDGILTVHLHQASQQKRNLLTRFRLASSDHRQLSEWARIPAEIRSVIRSEKPAKPDLDKIAAYHRSIAEELAPQRREIAKLEKQLNAIKPATVPVMQDLPAANHRDTHVQVRGNYKNTGEQVSRGTPATFHPLRKNLPRNRLALAHWLVDPENPLTARVIANRFWQQIFGTGIVQTCEEFGSQGDLPTHPELLDWLALELQDSDWNVKAFLKTLVTSATYRQASEATPESLEADRFNQLYARGPRFRISAEMVRDQALFVSGLLSDKMFGRPVNPPQPQLGLKAAFGSATDWKTSAGEDKFRRGIYTTWRRSSPYASMATFDAPNREVCTSRRIRTNTPLQALVTLNDPVYVEAAQALARRIIQEGGSTLEDKLSFAWRSVLIREPNASELQRLVDLYQGAREDFSARPDEALTFATNPIGPLPKEIEAAEIAAWTLVANVLLNLDELFLKR